MKPYYAGEKPISWCFVQVCNSTGIGCKRAEYRAYPGMIFTRHYLAAWLLVFS